jgi:hypothetical protein
VKRRDALTGLVLAVLTASAVSLPAQEQGRRRRQNNVITAEEVAQSSASTAYDAIRTLRPAWFIPRGASGRAAIMVYIDGVRGASLDDLREVQADRVKECRFLNANDATTKYGTGHPAGAIEIITKR